MDGLKQIILLSLFAIANLLFAAAGGDVVEIEDQIVFVFPDGQKFSVDKELFVENLGHFQGLENLNQDFSEPMLVEDMIGRVSWSESISVAHFLLLQNLIQYDNHQSLKDFFNSIADFNDLMKVYVLADFFMLTDPSADFKRLEIMQEVLKQRCKALTEQEFMQVNIPLLAFIMDLGFLDKNDVLKFVWAGDKVDRISFSPDGVYISIQYNYSFNNRHEIKRLNDLNGVPVWTNDNISDVIFSSDGFYVAIQYYDGDSYRVEIKRLDDLNGPPVWVGERIRWVSFSPDGVYVAIQYYDGDSYRVEIKKLDNLNGDPIWTNDNISDVIFSPDGVYVAIQYYDGGSYRSVIKRLNDLNGTPMWTSGADVFNVIFSPDGVYVAIQYYDGGSYRSVIKRLDDLNGDIVWRGDNVRSIAFSPDGVYVVIKYLRSLCEIKRLNDLNGDVVWRGAHVSDVIFTPDKVYVPIQYYDRGRYSCEIKRLDDLNGPPVWAGERIRWVSFSPDGVYVVIIYFNNRAEIKRLIPLFKNESSHFDLLMSYRLQVAKTIKDLTDEDKEYFLSLSTYIQKELIKQNSLLNDLVFGYKSRLEKMRVVLFEPTEQDKSFEEKRRAASGPETTTPAYGSTVSAAVASGTSAEATGQTAEVDLSDPEKAGRKATATVPRPESKSSDKISDDLDKVD